MTQIQIINITRQPAGYIELTYKMSLTLPSIWGTGANPIAGLDKIVGSYAARFSTEVIPVTGTIVTVVETISVPSDVIQATIRTQLQNRYNALRSQLDGLTLDAWDGAVGQSWDGSSWATINNITDNPVVSNNQSNLGITATGAAAAAVTLTIPAVAGKFHNINHISIQAYSSAARTGSATPVLVTTTNLPGSPVFTFASAGAIGTTDEKKLESCLPIKSLVANTATTIICPATTGIIWRVTVFYNLST